MTNQEGPRIEEINIPANLDQTSKNELIGGEVRYSMAGLIVGLICVLGGLYLFTSGITGNINFEFGLGGVNAKLSNAAPGALLFVLGLLIIWFTRYKVTVTDGARGKK